MQELGKIIAFLAGLLFIILFLAFVMAIVQDMWRSLVKLLSPDDAPAPSRTRHAPVIAPRAPSLSERRPRSRTSLSSSSTMCLMLERLTATNSTTSTTRNMIMMRRSMRTSRMSMINRTWTAVSGRIRSTWKAKMMMTRTMIRIRCDQGNYLYKIYLY